MWCVCVLKRVVGGVTKNLHKNLQNIEKTKNMKMIAENGKRPNNLFEIGLLLVVEIFSFGSPPGGTPTQRPKHTKTKGIEGECSCLKRGFGD